MKLKTEAVRCKKCNKPFSREPGSGISYCKACFDEYNHRKAVHHVEKCKTCGKEFVVTVGEMEWLASKGFEPFKRCESCRKLKKEGKSNEQ